MAPLMFDCFTSTPDFTAYTALPNNVPSPREPGGTAALSHKQQYWANNFSKWISQNPMHINEINSIGTFGS